MTQSNEHSLVPATAQFDATLTTMQGYLKKKATTSVVGKKPWQKRWFVLSKHELSYFQSDKAQTPSGVFAGALLAEVAPSHKSKKRFDVQTDMRLLSLEAESESECQQWLTAFKALGFKVAASPFGDGPIKSFSEGPAEHKPQSAGAAGSAGAASASSGASAAAAIGTAAASASKPAALRSDTFAGAGAGQSESDSPHTIAFWQGSDSDRQQLLPWSNSGDSTLPAAAAAGGSGGSKRVRWTMSADPTREEAAAAATAPRPQNEQVARLLEKASGSPRGSLSGGSGSSSTDLTSSSAATASSRSPDAGTGPAGTSKGPRLKMHFVDSPLSYQQDESAGGADTRARGDSGMGIEEKGGTGDCCSRCVIS